MGIKIMRSIENQKKLEWEVWVADIGDYFYPEKNTKASALKLGKELRKKYTSVTVQANDGDEIKDETMIVL